MNSTLGDEAGQKMRPETTEPLRLSREIGSNAGALHCRFFGASPVASALDLRAGRDPNVNALKSTTTPRTFSTSAVIRKPGNASTSANPFTADCAMRALQSRSKNLPESCAANA